MKRRPAILASGDKAVAQFNHCGTCVRFRTATRSYGHQRIGFGGTCSQNPARSVIFEAAANQLLSVGKQSRGKGIAGKSFELIAVEAKGKWTAAVDQAAC